MSKMDMSPDELVHFGIPGMKWGVRKASSSSSAPSGSTEVVVTSKRGKKTTLQAKGGARHGPAQEAIDTIAAIQKSKASGLVTLSNKEIKDAVTRMNLEQQYIKLTGIDKTRGQQFIAKFLKIAGNKQVQKIAKDVWSSDQIAAALAKKTAKGAAKVVK